MKWTESNVQALLISAFASLVLVYVLTQGSADYGAVGAFHPGLESGKWAVRFLLISLAVTPSNTYFRWTGAVKLRKPAGLWAFGFALAHVYYYVEEAKWDWLTPQMPLYLVLGLYGLVVFAALAATSNRWSMRRLGKNWKRLHRMVYYAGPAILFHAVFAAGASKKMHLFDPNAVHELRIYLALLVVLLAVRHPQVRAPLKRLVAPQRRARIPESTVMPIDERSRTSIHWTPDLPVEREIPASAEELWRSPNGSFTWSAAGETDVWLEGTIDAQPEAPARRPTKTRYSHGPSARRLSPSNSTGSPEKASE